MTGQEMCPRCGIGMDDDGDGDCVVCASASNHLVAVLQAVRSHLRRANEELRLLRLEHNEALRRNKK